MRFALGLALLTIVACSSACDDPKSSGTGAAPTATASAAPTLTAKATVTATATAAPTATVASPPMPPRPFPVGSSGPVQPSAPQEQQMMAITYTIAMVQPRGGDAPTVDQTYLDDITKKLESVVRIGDKGKTPPNPIKATRGNRKIEIEMGKGCTDKTPSQMAVRAGTTLKAAYEAGVLVIACHDDKWECHQSTRDPNDVLCHAAPRR